MTEFRKGAIFTAAIREEHRALLPAQSARDSKKAKTAGEEGHCGSPIVGHRLLHIELCCHNVAKKGKPISEM